MRLFSTAKVLLSSSRSIYFCLLSSASKPNTRWFCSAGNSEKAVYSFGDGSHGALGLPFPGDAHVPTHVEGLPGHVSSVTAGHYHSLAVTCDGEVWAWGRNEEGQLGRALDCPRQSWNQPKKVEGLDKVEVISAAASGVVSMAISNNGSLWVWGKSKRGQLGLGKGITEALVPQRVEALAGQHVVQVALGWGHALACTVEGKLYSWGYAADGRLGLITSCLEEPKSQNKLNLSPDTKNPESKASRFEIAEKLVLEELEKEKNLPICWKPCLVNDLNLLHVVDIACGLDHSLVLCDNGLLFSYGENTYGQLGRLSNGSHLQSVDLNQKVVSIAAGVGHSLAIAVDQPSNTSGGDNRLNACISEGLNRSIFSWGWNSTSQLGRSEGEVLSRPGRVKGLEGEEPVSVSAGRAHSIAITSKRELWVWGCGRNGRLGLGSNFDEPEPYPVEALEGLKVLQAVCGFDHNLLLVD
ncbi:hypothetical protein SUGI_0088610 [Cryptomeria japonica]|uniref:ultraviolet-B receptor UVR8 n=1 Tax=Cryptomeria japonica TaxID=3369 RepID=UPI0024089789|nr:ultraviolet-B receptor UVR8 [Cryptomeria japonica]GLJ08431.1 hypothetical protein SUGI_0088610 [Cryptomeria japonica]